MRLVQLMVGAMVLASTAPSHAAPAQDTSGLLAEADASLERSDVTGAQLALTRVAMEVAGATMPGRDAQVAVGGALAALDAHPASRSPGFQMGWRLGFAEARAGKYADHRLPKGDPSRDTFYQGYEAGWAAGNAPGL